MVADVRSLPTTATEPEPGVETRGGGIFTAPKGASGTGVSMVEAINAALHEEMVRDARVVVLGEDVGAKGGVFGATKGLLDRFGPERVIDTPIAESGFTGFGAGLAMGGLVPVVEIQFMDFIMSALDQIFTDIAKMHYRTNGDVNVPLVIRVPVGGGIRGGFYHSQTAENLFITPGLKVVMPSAPTDAKGLLKAAIRDPDPVIFLEHKGLYRSIREPVPEGDDPIPLGRARIRRAGTDCTVITYGATVRTSLAAAESLAEDGIETEVLDLRTLHPFDHGAILRAVAKTHRCLIVHESSLTGGFGGELAAFVGQHAFEELDAPVTRLTGPDVPAMPFSEPLERAFLLSPEQIAATVRDLVAY
jgi:2-oxoisovalerate dehydrogenase E1 component beta subunit